MRYEKRPSVTSSAGATLGKNWNLVAGQGAGFNKLLTSSHSFLNMFVLGYLYLLYFFHSSN